MISIKIKRTQFGVASQSVRLIRSSLSNLTSELGNLHDVRDMSNNLAGGALTVEEET
jgi:hypothetical protein